MAPDAATPAPANPTQGAERPIGDEAREAYRRAHGIVAELMHDLRFGYAIETDNARSAVEGLLLSVLRDTDAATYLALLNNTYADLARRSVHVAIMALAFGKCIGIPKDKMLSLGLGALLCDVGMARVPRSVYERDGALSAEERELVRLHVTSGVALLKRGSVPPEAVDVVALHHERHDGTGYPGRRRGKEIPLLARMVPIASVYLAISSRRPHSAALSMKEALARVYEDSGAAFDPTLVQKFIRCVGVFPPGCVVELASGEIGIVTATNPHQRLRPTVRIHFAAGRRPLPAPQEVELAGEDEARRIVRSLRPDEYQIVAGTSLDEDRLVLVSR